MSDNTEIVKKKWSRNKKIWAHGLGSATILGIAHSITPALVAPDTFNFTTGLQKLLVVIAVSGLMGAFTYLSKSPLPEMPKELQNDEP